MHIPISGKHVIQVKMDHMDFTPEKKPSKRGRIVQKLDLDGWQKVKGLVRSASSQPFTQSDQKRPSISANKAAIVHSFAEFEGEEPAIRQGEEALDGESKTSKRYQLRILRWLSSGVQWRNPKVIIDDAAKNWSFSDEPFSYGIRSLNG